MAELDWIIERAVEHLGEERATRYLRKFYPWYLERSGAEEALQDGLQRADTLAQARQLLGLVTV
jgi:tRNA-dihydrouridine synthase